jgi:hypothetical protein
MAKAQRKTFVKRSHTGRNISILAILVVVVVLAVALSGALTPAPPAATYAMVVHVYDSKYQSMVHSVYNLTESMLIENVTVTVAGVDQPTRFTPTGIIVYDQLPAGTYTINVSGNATIVAPYSYVLGANCPDQTPDGQCHALVAATITHS